MEQSDERRLVFHQLPGPLAIVRLDPGSEIPGWAWAGSLSAVVRTSRELSIVCDETVVPNDVRAEKGWVALMLEGQFPLSMVGVLSSILEPLAKTRISVFVLSTFETDCVLVKAEQIERAMQVLGSEGHRVVNLAMHDQWHTVPRPK